MVSALLSSLWSSQTMSEGVVFRTVFQKQEGDRGKRPEIRSVSDAVINAILVMNKPASLGDGIVHCLHILLRLILELDSPAPKCPGPTMSMING